MERIASYLNHNGALVHIKDLKRKRTKNKASPPITKSRLCYRSMIQQPFTKPQAIPFSLGKGTYEQRVLPTGTVQLLAAQKPVENELWALYKFYKTT